MASPSIPITSVMLVTLRLPSDKRAAWTMTLRAEAICQRTARSGKFNWAIATNISTRLSASFGVLAWIVVNEPSWPVFMA